MHLLEAENLAEKDHFLGIPGKSDPYAKLSIGLQHFRSKTIYKDLNPTWNEVFEVSPLIHASFPRVDLALKALSKPLWGGHWACHRHASFVILLPTSSWLPGQCLLHLGQFFWSMGSRTLEELWL